MSVKMCLRMTLWMGILAFLVWVPAAQAVYYQYTIIDYPGVPSSFIYGINSSGTEMAGWLPSGHGFKTDGKVFPLVDVPGYSETYAMGINAAGKIVGQCLSGSTSHGFVNAGTDFTVFDVPVTGTTGTAAFKINDIDQIVGTYFTPNNHGFVKTGESFYYFDYPNSTDTEARGINNKGQVAGRYWDAAQNIHGFVHDITANTYTPIDYPGAVATGIYGINDLGQMVGYYQDGGGSVHPLVYSGGVFTILHIPGEGTFSFAHANDNHGNVVGAYRYDSSNFHGFQAKPIFVTPIYELLLN